jgi:hypothetical protein
MKPEIVISALLIVLSLQKLFAVLVLVFFLPRRKNNSGCLRELSFRFGQRRPSRLPDKAMTGDKLALS